MTNKAIENTLRPVFTRLGLVLLIYYGLMNVIVSLAIMIDAVILFLSYPGTEIEYLIDLIVERSLGNGWGYILTSLIGAALLLLWKKRAFCFHEIWRTERSLSAGSLAMMLCLMIGSQAVFQIIAIFMERFFSLFGLSVMEAMESASATADTFSMFLYITIVAPIFEEILFRGLILRSLKPYGKRFAILTSAFLFGIFHGNIVQTPFAFLVGLLLGYITVEYSLGWAIFLHTFNNMILGDALGRLSRLLPPGVGELLQLLLIWICALAAILILIIKRNKITAYFKMKMHPACLKSFFTAPGILIFSCLMALNILLSVLLSAL